MVNYPCPNCGKNFNQKVHFDRHKARKNPCKKVVQSGTATHVAEGSTMIVQTKQETKPLSWFNENFHEMYKTVTKDLHALVTKGERLIVFKAEVKTGKRFAVEIYASYTTPVNPESIREGDRIAHVFISSWVRRADDKQRLELNAYLRGTKADPRVFKINSKSSRVRCIKKLEELSKKNNLIIVHLDELDYGSGNEQHMATVYEYCVNQDKITLVCYSASPEEAMVAQLSTISSIKPKEVIYKAPPNYRGARWFCEQNLVKDSVPFFHIGDDGSVSLSDSAKEILVNTKRRILSSDLKENKRKLIIVRQNVDFGHMYKLIKLDKKVPELATNPTDDVRILTHFVHSKSEFNTLTVKWDDYSWWKEQFEVERTGNFMMVLFIDQCSSRSTDWFCHPWLSAYHDHHSSETPLNTSLQSNLRAVYYTNKFCDGVKVYNDEEFFPEIYGQKDVIEYAAGLRGLNTITRKVSSRSKVFENTGTYGPVILVNCLDEMEKLKQLMEPNLNHLTAEQKVELQQLVLKKLKPAQKQTVVGKPFEERTLKGKRKYKQREDQVGGIYTVATKYLRKINSGPGGSEGDMDLRNEAWHQRENWFWIDVALEDITFTWEEEEIKINKGDVYITHGTPDEEASDDDSSSVSSTNYQHARGKKSMYTR